MICQAVYRGTQSFCPIDGGAIVEPDADEDPYVGRTIDGRYLVHRRIGRGGMGVVYEAVHVGLDKRVALKFLLGASDADALARFRREARIASKIDHDNVVNILDVGRDERGVDYLAMELVDGRDLQHILRDGGLAVARAVSVVRQILNGLAAIHAAGILHRDLKPSNVIIVGDVAKIMDFGISKAMAPATVDDVTQTGAVIGTPQYMSPEQLLGGEVDERSELFAVGLILFAALAGEPPLQDNTVAKLAAFHATQDIPSLATRRELPVALVEVVAKALSRSPEDRHASAADFERALAGVDLAGPVAEGDRWMLRTAKVGSAGTAETKRERRAEDSPAITSRSPRSRVGWVAAAVVLVGAIGAVLYATRSSARVATVDAVLASDAATAASDGSATDAGVQLELARRADADGKLELAIALYADLSNPPATVVFRLGELYERAGNTAKAAASFTRYLELVPAASDLEVVRTRIARLQATSAPVDAGVPAPPRRPPVVIAKVDTRPNKQCYCFEKNGSDATHFRLCRGRAKEPLRCSCRGKPTASSSVVSLCSKPGKECSGSSEPGCFDLLLCDDPEWGALTVTAKPGEPCSGYRHTDTLIQGAYECPRCDQALGLIYQGHQGDACVGYAFTTGAKIEGHLNNCW